MENHDDESMWVLPAYLASEVRAMHSASEGMLFDWHRTSAAQDFFFFPGTTLGGLALSYVLVGGVFPYLENSCQR